jgi:ADP-heptose:LPS heptosyltransferase
MAERFLAIKLADLGDALTATPALRALRSSFPGATIDTLVTAVGAEVLSGLDSVDHLICFQKASFDRLPPSLRPVGQALALGMRLRRTGYTRVFLFHHLFTRAGRLKYAALLGAIGAPWRAGCAEGKPAFLDAIYPDRGYGVCHEADYWLGVAGLAGAVNLNPRLEVRVDLLARARARQLLATALDERSFRRVALYPGSGSYSLARRWPAEGYAQVGRDLIRQAKVEIVVVGGPREEDLAAQICRNVGPLARNLAGATDLKMLAAVLESCDLLVGNDGGIMHLAVAVGTPVVAVFGPSNHRSWGPYQGVDWSSWLGAKSRHVIVRRDLACAPCLYRGYLPGTRFGCRSRECLTTLDATMVSEAALALLSAVRPAR